MRDPGVARFLDYQGVMSRATMAAVMNRIMVPRTAAPASFSLRSETQPRWPGLPKMTERGRPEEARTKEPTTSLGAMAAPLASISRSVPIARVGETMMERMPVSGWMESQDRALVRPSLIYFQMPR